MKACFKCGETKPLADFYRHRAMADGHLKKCKVCAKADVAAHRQKNIDAIREYDRRRATSPARREFASAVQRRWRQAHPDRRAAQMLLRKAVKSGDVKPTPCWVCGSTAEAHHPDYSRPLDVVWLCSAHHKQAHAVGASLGQ